MLSVIYREVRPDERLAPYLKCLWYMERDYAVVTAPETIWPDGKVELLVHFGELYDSPQGRLPPAFVIGPLTRYLPLRLRPAGDPRQPGDRPAGRGLPARLLRLPALRQELSALLRADPRGFPGVCAAAAGGYARQVGRRFFTSPQTLSVVC